MKIATWNVNSIKARLPNLLDWLRDATPDVVLLQEIKTVEDNFPLLEGRGGRNGVPGPVVISNNGHRYGRITT